MTALEIRILGYGILTIMLVAGGFALGARHVQAQWNVDKLARDGALQTQQQLVIQFQKQRDTLQQQVDDSHAHILANGNALVDGVSASLRGVEAALRSRGVSPAVVNPGAVQATKPGANGSAEFEASLRSVAAEIERLGTDCVRVDSDRTSIIALEPKP